jgi:hypothetical protein
MQIVSTSPDIDKLQGDERLWAYNCFDTCVTLEIFENLQPQRNETYEFEKQLLKPTLRMMERGFRVNHERGRTVIPSDLLNVREEYGTDVLETPQRKQEQQKAVPA